MKLRYTERAIADPQISLSSCSAYATVSTMINILEEAIEKVKTLSEERQRYAAHVLEQIAGAGDDVYRLSDEERRLVREGLADLEAGRIVSDADMDAFWRRNRP